MGLYHKLQTVKPFLKLIFFIQMRVYKLWMIIQSSRFEGFDEDHFV